MRLPRLIAALAAFALLAACGKKPAPVPPAASPAPAAPAQPAAAKSTPTPTPPPTPTPTPAPPQDPLSTRIGFLAPLSGAQSSFGKDAVSGAELALDQINASGGVLGHPLKLIIKDTASSPDRTAAVATELLEKDQVSALIGEIATDRSLAAAPLAQAHGIPMITPASTNEKVTAVGECIFRVCYTDAFQASVMAGFARSVEAGRAAVLCNLSDPYSAGLAEIFKTDYIRAGGEIVSEQTYRSDDTDFAAPLDAIKDQRPDVIFLPSYYPDAARIIRQARTLGLDMPFLGTDGWDSPEFLAVGGPAVENCYFCSHFSPDSTAPALGAFLKAYSAKYSATPPPLAALSYDAVTLAADALKRAGSAEPAALRATLAATRDFPGATGSITLDDHRNPRKPGIVIRIENGKFTYLQTINP